MFTSESIKKNKVLLEKLHFAFKETGKFFFVRLLITDIFKKACYVIIFIWG
jgi:hypothetical protein